jgi:tetratricopeptide (TPR) repeat protein
MKKIVTGIILIIFSCVAFSQGSLESGNTKFEAGDYEGAVVDYFDYTYENPDDKSGWYNLALAQLKLENPDGAVTYFTKAIELDPLYAKAWLSRGMSNEENGDDDEAIADYSKAFEIDPTLLSALYKKARLYSSMLEYDSAFAVITQYIDAGGELLADAYYIRAFVSNRKEYFDFDPVPDLEKAAGLGKKDKFVIYEVGYAHQNNGEWDKAIVAFSKVIEKDAEYKNAWLRRGECKISAEDKAGGCEDLNKALELGSEDAEYDIRKYCG